MEHHNAGGVSLRTVERIRTRQEDYLVDPPRIERDVVVVEAPLEIRVGGAPWSVTMRTPGADESLVLGLLFVEGVIVSIDEIERVTPSWAPGEDGAAAVADVLPAAGARAAVERAIAERREAAPGALKEAMDMEASGARSGRGVPIATGTRVSPEVVIACADRLRDALPEVARTGGLHGAGAFTAAGGILAARSDVVQRHAVDKVVGELLRRRLVGVGGCAPEAERPAILAVTGRAGVEVVRRGAAAQIPVVACAAAATSLGVDLARAAGVTLAAFARGGALSVYARADRLAAQPSLAGAP
ncbi:MAG: formate dehydrogenase accessory sulfurtransferase FdhD [Polyangiaceae bacterium]|nr:formate dehydrogenase accessory sulfurtransferase FdhD [Polyangiaceae bacterium]